MIRPAEIAPNPQMIARPGAYQMFAATLPISSSVSVTGPFADEGAL